MLYEADEYTKNIVHLITKTKKRFVIASYMAFIFVSFMVTSALAIQIGLIWSQLIGIVVGAGIFYLIKLESMRIVKSLDKKLIASMNKLIREGNFSIQDFIDDDDDDDEEDPKTYIH